MKNLIIAIILLLSIISCSNSGKTQKPFEIITLNEKSLPPVQSLNLEKVDLSEEYTMGNSSCFIYQDTVLIVLKDGDPYPLTHMLTLVNMNTGEKIGEYFTHGQGPQELLSVLPRFSYNRLDLCCYTTNKLISFNIDSALIKGCNYIANILYANNYKFSEWASIDDTLFLTTNPFYFDGCKECEENSKLPEFYWIGKNGTFTPEYKNTDYKKIKYLTSDVYSQTISINKEKKRIVCCYEYQPYIKIFDDKLNVIKKIDGPEPDDGKYEPIDNFIYFHINTGINHYYYSATCDSENIIVINRRNHSYKDDIDEINEFENRNSEIFRLDWDGNIIGRYKAKGKHIIHENYCKSSNTLYIWTKEDGEGCMYKAKLD